MCQLMEWIIIKLSWYFLKKYVSFVELVTGTRMNASLF